jgi:hypothetical protein
VTSTVKLNRMVRTVSPFLRNSLQTVPYNIFTRKDPIFTNLSKIFTAVYHPDGINMQGRMLPFILVFTLKRPISLSGFLNTPFKRTHLPMGKKGIWNLLITQVVSGSSPFFPLMIIKREQPSADDIRLYHQLYGINCRPQAMSSRWQTFSVVVTSATG